MTCQFESEKYTFFAISGKSITEEQLMEVANVSAVTEAEEDYLELNFRQQCQAIIPNPQDICPCDCAKMYLLLKRNLQQNT